MGESNAATEAAPPAELRRAFWIIVALLNVAFFAFALGGLLFVFRGELRAAVGLLAIGLVALLAAWRRYRRVQGSKA